MSDIEIQREETATTDQCSTKLAIQPNKKRTIPNIFRFFMKSLSQKSTEESETDDAERHRNPRRQEELNKKLLEAAEAGNNEDLIQQISDGAEINSRDHFKNTGPHICAKKGHKDVMETFIKNKVDVNIRGAYKYTALMQAADNGRLSCVQLLLTHKADTNLRNWYGQTALMWAARRNYPDIIAELLSHGADDQIQDIDRKNALKYAAIKGNHDVVRVLKASKETTDKLNKEIVAEAKKEDCNWKHIKRLITVHPDINHLNKKGESVLRLAWNAENIKLVKILLDKGAQFDLQNARGETSLKIEQYVEKNDVQKREQVITLMIEYDKKRNPTSLADSQFRIKKEIKKIVPSSGNLRDCLRSVSDKYPWTVTKYKVMLALSFILQVIRGSFFYGLDVYTDIQFTLEMYRQGNRNFVQDLSKCQSTFEKNFDVTIETCKMHFDKNACLESIAQVD